MKNKYIGWGEGLYNGNSDMPIIIKDGDKDKIVAMFRNIEDRDRVLACVGALKGISTEALKGGVEVTQVCTCESMKGICIASGCPVHDKGCLEVYDG